MEWNREHTYRSENIPGIGVVENWCDVTEASNEFVSFRRTHIFHADGAQLVSDSTLPFRSADEKSLRDNAFTVEDVRDAPNRPGREFVFVAIVNDRSSQTE